MSEDRSELVSVSFNDVHDRSMAILDSLRGVTNVVGAGACALTLARIVSTKTLTTDDEIDITRSLVEFAGAALNSGKTVES